MDGLTALILARGISTALRPLTYTRPRHLLPIANRPHIEHIFDLLARCGVGRIVVLTGLPRAFQESVEAARARGLRVDVHRERQYWGTGGAVRNAEPLIEGETFLAVNGDILTDTDLTELMEVHRERDAQATMLLATVEDPHRFGIVSTSPEGRVVRFAEKRSDDGRVPALVNAGVYFLHRSVLERIPRGTVWSLERHLFPELIDRGADFYAMTTGSYWIETGTPREYLKANLDALLGLYQNGTEAPRNDNMTVVGDGARVDPTASTYLSCIGTGAVVEAGAAVERSVLLPGSVVCSGATVRSSIIGVGARVAGLTWVEGETVGDAGVVTASSSLFPSRLRRIQPAPSI